MIDLVSFLKDKEWYDNHSIDTWLACRRKWFFGNRFEGGLDPGVGAGANFGTCIHEAFGSYYGQTNWLSFSEPARRIMAVRAFDRKYRELFLVPPENNKHLLQNGIDILDQYFNDMLPEDRLYQPIESEIGFMVPIIPLPGDPREFHEGGPFYYGGRIDQVMLRLRTQELFVFETKTTGSGVERERLCLILSRQPMGYFWSALQFPQKYPVVGIIPNIVLVATGTRENRRDVYMKNASDAEVWRAQTVRIVMDIRRTVGKSNGLDLYDTLNEFYQTTQECTSYGKCGFHDMCRFGPRNVTTFPPKRTWTPFGIMEE